MLVVNESDAKSDPSHPPIDAWADRPRAELLRLAWPIAVSTVSYAVMTLVDTLFVGRIGPAALAGVGLGGVAAFTLLCFPMGLLRGTKVLVSQAIGAGQRDAPRRHAAAGVFVALAFGAAGVGLSVGLAELLPALTATPASGAAARTYLRIRMVGAPAFLLYVALREARYGLGDSRSPMAASIAANVVNVALDALLIGVFEMGVAGAAWASVAGHVAEAGVLVMRQREEGLVRPTRADLAELLDVGVPTGVQFLLEVGSFSILTAILSSLDEREMAAHQIALQVAHFTFLPLVAVSEAASVLAGQAVGARREALVGRVTREALKTCFLYAALCTVVLVGFGGPIADAFTDDAPLRAIARNLLIVAALFQFLDAAQVVAHGVLRGAGDVRYAAKVAVAASWLAIPPLTWLLGVEAGLGALGGWIGICVELGVAGALLWRRFRSGAWQEVAARRRARAEAAAIAA